MEDLIQEAKKFYASNEKIAIALVSSIATLLVTLITIFFRNLIDVAKHFYSKLTRLAGGRLAHRSFIGSYLNWVVLEYQDLNLTGLIGEGPKPKVEQVFISLELTERAPSPVEEAKRSIWSQLRKWALERLRSVIAITVESTPSAEFRLINPRRKTWFESVLRITANGVFMGAVGTTLLIAIAVVPLLQLEDNTSLSILIPTQLTVVLLSTSYLARRIIYLRAILASLGVTYLTIFVSFQPLGIEPLPFFLSLLAGIVLGLSPIYFSQSLDLDAHTDSQIARVVEHHDNVAVLGRPGAGKSTYIQFLALSLARERAGDRTLRRRGTTRRVLGLSRWYVPILIPLRKVSHILAGDKPSHNVSLLEAWRQRVLPFDIRNGMPEHLLSSLLHKRKCMILLDGLDEVADDQEFDAVVREIKGLASLYKGNKFIVTSRFAGWRGGVGSTFGEFEIANLSDDQIEGFIDAWYTAVGESGVPLVRERPAEKMQRLRKTRSRAEDLKEVMKTIRSIRALAENPLLLSIVCFVHYHKVLPRERLALYQDCSNLLLLQWDKEKGIHVDDTDLTVRRKEILMQEIAFAMHSGKIGRESGGKEASSSEIIPLIESKLGEFRMPIGQASALFHKLVDRSGLMVAVERYADRFSFSHLTFQEFYAAKYIYKNDSSLIQRAVAGSVDRLADWWQEVILLYSAMADDSSHLLRSLVDYNRDEADDLSSRRLQIAAQCLDESVGVRDRSTEGIILKRMLTLRSGASLSQIYSMDILRPYLLRLASQPGFRPLALKARIKKLKQDIAPDLLASKLFEIGRSVDGLLASTAMEIIREMNLIASLSPSTQSDYLLEALRHQDERVLEQAVLISLNLFDIQVPKELALRIAEALATGSSDMLMLKEFVGRFSRVRFISDLDRDWFIRELKSLYIKRRAYVGVDVLLAALIINMSQTEERARLIEDLSFLLASYDSFVKIDGLMILSLLSSQFLNENLRTLVELCLFDDSAMVRRNALLVIKASEGALFQASLRDALEIGLKNGEGTRLGRLVRRARLSKGFLGSRRIERALICSIIRDMGYPSGEDRLIDMVLGCVDENDIEGAVECVAQLSEAPLSSDSTLRLAQKCKQMVSQLNRADDHVVRFMSNVSKFSLGHSDACILMRDSIAKYVDTSEDLEMKLKLSEVLALVDINQSKLRETIRPWITSLFEHPSWGVADRAFSLAEKAELSTQKLE